LISDFELFECQEYWHKSQTKRYVSIYNTMQLNGSVYVISHSYIYDICASFDSSAQK